MQHNPPPLPRIHPSWRIGIVSSTYHGDIVSRLEHGARTLLEQSGIPSSNILSYSAPGSFEVPLIGEAVARAKSVDALIGFGVIVQGETFHAQLIAQSVTSAMMDIQLRHAMPFAFEILHVHTIEQAEARSHGAMNKGAEAARAVLQSLHTLSHIHSDTATGN